MKATKEGILKWFREEDKDSELLIDKKWMVQESDEGNMVFAHMDEIPFGIGVEFIDSFADLILYTNVETATMSKDERLELYRKLLIMNDENHMVKATLAGRNDEIALRTDLDVKSISKEEFNDAIVSIIVGAVAIQDILGIKGDEDDEEESQRIMEFVLDALQTKTKDEVVKMLMDKTGMKEEDAVNIVEKVQKEWKPKPPEGMYS